MKDYEIPSHSIGLYVANKPGVLNRIALVFSRRGYNIDSLVVSEAKDSDFSHMNIAARGDKETLDQILKQLNKLVDVVHARDYAGIDIVERELSLLKVNSPTEKRTEILQVAQAFKCDTVDLTDTTITFQITGTTAKINAAKKVLGSYGLLEVIRTGKVLITRGEELTAFTNGRKKKLS